MDKSKPLKSTYTLERSALQTINAGFVRQNDFQAENPSVFEAFRNTRGENGKPFFGLGWSRFITERLGYRFTTPYQFLQDYGIRVKSSEINKPYDHKLRTMSVEEFKEYCQKLAAIPAAKRKTKTPKPLTPQAQAVLDHALRLHEQYGYVPSKHLKQALQKGKVQITPRLLDTTMNMLRFKGFLPRPTNLSYTKLPPQRTQQEARDLVRQNEGLIGRTLQAYYPIWSTGVHKLEYEEARNSVLKAFQRAAELYQPRPGRKLSPYFMKWAKKQLWQETHPDNSLPTESLSQPQEELRYTREETIGTFTDPATKMKADQAIREMLQMHSKKMLSQRGLLSYYLTKYQSMDSPSIAKALEAVEGKPISKQAVNKHYHEAARKIAAHFSHQTG